MCLAIPMKIIEIQGDSGVAEVRGISRRIDLSLVQPITLGECVLVHTGFALQKIDEEEFEKTLAILQELGEGLEDDGPERGVSREQAEDERPQFFQAG